MTVAQRSKIGLFALVSSVVVAVFALWLGNRIQDPAPLSAATGIVFGLSGLWILRRARFAGLVVGLLVGLLAGVAGHWRVHATGGSPEPEEGLLMHFAADALRGGYVALPALVVAWLLAVWPRASRP